MTPTATSRPPTAVAELPATADLLVIGGGVVGLTVAITLKQRLPDQRVVVLEKEPACGLHASGRNSGVLHAGFYYTADSLKARLCRDGSERMGAWCEERGLEVRRCGKLVVARRAEDLPVFDTLLERAHANGVVLKRISAQDAAEIEPRAITVEQALFAPATASVDPAAVMVALAQEARSLGVVVCDGVRWLGRTGDTVHTSAGDLAAGFVLNAAGLYADRVAGAYGFGERYRILPFRGLYLLGEASAGPMRCHVYPVPDLGMPFLGVHTTLSVHGTIKLGPTALPALWRENYGGLSGFAADELAEVVSAEARLFFTDATFRSLAWRELRKAVRSYLVRESAQLVTGLRVGDFRRWGRPGIRAQLLERATGRLEQDFVVEGDARSLHVLNAVSPAFSASWPFAEMLADRIVG